MVQGGKLNRMEQSWPQGTLWKAGKEWGGRGSEIIWDTSESECVSLSRKKKKSVSLSCPGKRFICILFLDSTYMCWHKNFVLYLFLTYGEVGWTGKLGQTCIHYHVWNRQLVGSCFIAHGAQLRALWWPRGVRWGEGKGSSGGGHICTRITDLPWCTAETNTTF